MGLFAKFKAGLQKTHSKLAHEIKRIVTALAQTRRCRRSKNWRPRSSPPTSAWPMTGQIVAAVKHAYETQGSAGLDVFAIARREVEKEPRRQTKPICARRRAARPSSPSSASMARARPPPPPSSPTWSSRAGQTALLAACDTFRAAAIEQIKLWGTAPQGRSHRRRVWRGRRLRGARRRHRRAGAQGGLPVH